MEKDDDRELIGRYLEGDADAFSEFYERHRRPVFAFLLSIVRQRETAEEIFQETFFAFLRSLGRLDDRSSFRPFLLRTARNLAIDRLRREKAGEKALRARAADPFFALDPSRGSGPPGDPERVTALLLDLPAEQREAVVLKHIGGLTFREIGELTGAPEDTAVSRYRYALKKLRAALAPGGCDDGKR